MGRFVTLFLECAGVSMQYVFTILWKSQSRDILFKESLNEFWYPDYIHVTSIIFSDHTCCHGNIQNMIFIKIHEDNTVFVIFHKLQHTSSPYLTDRKIFTQASSLQNFVQSYHRKFGLQRFSCLCGNLSFLEIIYTKTLKMNDKSTFDLHICRVYWYLKVYSSKLRKIV